MPTPSDPPEQPTAGADRSGEVAARRQAALDRPPRAVPKQQPVLVPPALARVAAISWRLLIILAATAALAFALVYLRVIVLPVILALFVATLLTPLVNRLRGRDWPRMAAAWTVFLTALLVLGGLITLFVPLVAADFPEIQRRAVEGFGELEQFLTQPPFNFSQEQISSFVNQAWTQIRSNSQGITTGVISGAILAGEIVAGTIIMVVLVFFLIKDSDIISRWVLGLFNAGAREHLRAMGTRAAATVSGYLRGIVIVGLFDAFFIGLGLVILGVPLAAPLALLTFFAAFFPLVGAVTAGALAALVALVTQGLVTALIVVGLALAVQQIEGNVLAPLVLGRAVKLHPVAIMLALSIGTILGGIPGAFLSVPTAAVIAAVSGYLRGDEPPEVTAEATERSAPGNPGE